MYAGDARDLDLSRATHVFANAVCLPNTVLNELQRKLTLEPEHPGTLFLTTYDGGMSKGRGFRGRRLENIVPLGGRKGEVASLWRLAEIAGAAQETSTASSSAEL
eukprot:NODE_15460_length_1049_cov_2.622560.p1 GENE.NODE_15460_length_1049_cov_2.622560~~NODE_15460_length_1049_cov_2.622560.p1  ORF type:complete len:105 (-),score=32.52 NODE_15460_length_1049_cov_2.622560:176-490(-)